MINKYKDHILNTIKEKDYLVGCAVVPNNSPNKINNSILNSCCYSKLKKYNNNNNIKYLLYFHFSASFRFSFSFSLLYHQLYEFIFCIFIFQLPFAFLSISPFLCYTTINNYMMISHHHTPPHLIVAVSYNIKNYFFIIIINNFFYYYYYY